MKRYQLSKNLKVFELVINFLSWGRESPSRGKQKADAKVLWQEDACEVTGRARKLK